MIGEKHYDDTGFISVRRTYLIISMAMADFAEVRFFVWSTDVRTCFPRPFVDSGHRPTHDKNKGLDEICTYLC